MTDHSTWSRDDYTYLLLALALTVFAIAPLTYPGYAQVHSGFIPAYNLAELAGKGLALNWTPDVASNSSAPLQGDGLLPYYLGLPVVWLGGTALAGVKMVFALSFVLGAAGMYVWLRPRLGPGGAALAALVYTYLPYHLAVVYVRGAWGEALFLGLLPWAMAAASGLGRSTETSKILPMALTALVWALLGLGQPGLAIWAFVVLVAWMVWVESGGRSEHVGPGDRKGRPYTALLAALGGTAVALVVEFLMRGFSFPASPINFFDHFLFPAQLFSAFWGYGASRPGWDDGLALGLGFAALGLTMLTLILVAARGRAQAQARAQANERAQPHERGQDGDLAIPSEQTLGRHPSSATQTESPSRLAIPSEQGLGRHDAPDALRLFALTLALILLLMPFSAFLWRLTGLYHTLTYPWQLLGLVGLCLSVLAGTSVRLDRRLAAPPAYAGLIILTLLASYAYLEPRFTQHTPGRGPLAAWDEGRLMLLDYNVSVAIPQAAAGLSESTIGQLPMDDYGPPHPGDTLHLTFTWQTTRPFYRDLKLFVHLLDASGQVIAQADPLAGVGAGAEGEDYFTSQWDPGELILDEVAIAIPPDAPPGPYQLAFGLYDGETLERLAVVGQEDASVVVGVGSKE